MPQRQPVAAIERRERLILRMYARAWQRILELQEAIADDPKQWRKLARLREVQREVERILNELDAFAQHWFSTEFPAIHAMGVNAGALELGVPAAQAWALIDTNAVSQLATEGFGDLLKATRLTRRTTKALIRSVLEDEILDKLIRGDTALASARRARKLIEQKGIYSVRYKDGSRHGLREYTNMAVRTKTATAYNMGALQAQEGLGIKFWEVFDGLDCTWPTGHGGGMGANGMVVDREEAERYPIAHPNCRRAYGARPDLSPIPWEPPPGQVLVPTAEARERVRERAEKRVDRRAAR